MSSSSEAEVEEGLKSTALIAGELDFPDVVCKLDGEVNENERRVQLGGTDSFRKIWRPERRPKYGTV